MKGNGIKLSEWAKQNGLTYKGAYRLFRIGKLPCQVKQLATGTIIVYPDQEQPSKVALYGRVSSHDQKDDLKRQMERLRGFAASKGMIIAIEKSEIASGLNGRRKGLLSLLNNKSISTIIVEYRDRLSRFGIEYIEALLNASGRQLIVMNEGEQKDDIVQDFIDIVTSMCARIYGKRSAKNRAKRALQATKTEQ